MQDARFYLPFLLFYLPLWVREQLVMEQVKPASETFVRKSGLVTADAVFRAPLRNGAGEGCLVVELQAARDSCMDLRAFGYKAGGLEQLMADGKKGRSRPGLVYVLVVYIGAEGWYPHLDPFRRLPPSAREAARRAWEKPAGFVNLRTAAATPPADEALLAAGILLLAHGRNPDPLGLLQRLDPLLAEVATQPDGRELVHRMLLYTGQVASGQNRLERVKLLEEGMIKHLHGIAREEAMSIWQAIGKEHELRGLRRGKLEVARNLLATGVELKIISQATGLSRQKLTALRKK